MSSNDKHLADEKQHARARRLGEVARMQVKAGDTVTITWQNRLLKVKVREVTTGHYGRVLHLARKQKPTKVTDELLVGGKK